MTSRLSYLLLAGSDYKPSEKAFLFTKFTFRNGGSDEDDI
jgi:hypothetical protein